MPLSRKSYRVTNNYDCTDFLHENHSTTIAIAIETSCNVCNIGQNLTGKIVEILRARRIMRRLSSDCDRASNDSRKNVTVLHQYTSIHFTLTFLVIPTCLIFLSFLKTPSRTLVVKVFSSCGYLYAHPPYSECGNKTVLAHEHCYFLYTYKHTHIHSMHAGRSNTVSLRSDMMV